MAGWKCRSVKVRCRMFILVICMMILVTLVLSAGAVLGDSGAVSVKVTVARCIHVENGSAVHSNVPVVRQVAGGYITFVSP